MVVPAGTGVGGGGKSGRGGVVHGTAAGVCERKTGGCQAGKPCVSALACDAYYTHTYVTPVLCLLSYVVHCTLHLLSLKKQNRCLRGQGGAYSYAACVVPHEGRQEPAQLTSNILIPATIVQEFNTTRTHSSRCKQPDPSSTTRA